MRHGNCRSSRSSSFHNSDFRSIIRCSSAFMAFQVPSLVYEVSSSASSDAFIRYWTQHPPMQFQVQTFQVQIYDFICQVCSSKFYYDPTTSYSSAFMATISSEIETFKLIIKFVFQHHRCLYGQADDNDYQGVSTRVEMRDAPSGNAGRSFLSCSCSECSSQGFSLIPQQCES